MRIPVATGNYEGLSIPELDRIVDRVLAYKPKPKTKAAKRRQRKKKRDAAKS